MIQVDPDQRSKPTFEYYYKWQDQIIEDQLRKTLGMNILLSSQNFMLPDLRIALFKKMFPTLLTDVLKIQVAQENQCLKTNLPIGIQ